MNFLNKFKQLLLIKYKTIQKTIIVFSIIFISLSMLWLMKDYSQHYEMAKEEIQTLFNEWHEGNIDTVGDIARIKEEELTIQTGFENYEDIQNIIHEKIYTGPEYQLNQLTIKKENQQYIADGKIIINTYDNLKIMNAIIEILLQDNSSIEMNYSQDDFINQNIDNIKNEINKYTKDFSKIVIVHMEYDENTKKWYIPFDKNNEFYNAISGNMIQLKDITIKDL